MKPRKHNKSILAQGLGWFSIVLGTVEVLIPRTLARLIGAPRNDSLFRFLGAREMAAGVGLLAGRAEPWLKARVAGDAMDLALLGAAFRSDDSEPERLAAAAAAVAAVTSLDIIAAQKHRDAPQRQAYGIRVRKVITINRPAEDLYRVWHNFEDLPHLMRHVESVEARDARRSHWVVKGPAGSRLQWNAEITEDRPNEKIAWRSLPGADVDNWGFVQFERAPGGRGTVVKVELEYRPTGGAFGAAVAKLLGEAPGKQLAVDLLRFKQWMETSEIAQTEGQPAGRKRSTSRKFDELVRA